MRRAIEALHSGPAEYHGLVECSLDGILGGVVYSFAAPHGLVYAWTSVADGRESLVISSTPPGR